MTTRLPTYFISHGGGPWPWMEEALHTLYAALAASLVDIPRQIGRKPRAILMVSAHWEEPAFTVQASSRPGMVYDYFGFPAHTYNVQYGSPGSPELAVEVLQLIRNAGLPGASDPDRGYDHGMFCPMAIMYPQADVPVIQLSLHNSLDPESHLSLGRALTRLRDENVLIVGSGLSYHNLRAFGPAGRDASASFDAWLADTMLAESTSLRTKRLIGWKQAPDALNAHPREEHLIPLMVAVGAAENDPAERVYHEERFAGGITVSSFRLG